ncbi:MAG: hypothetical protein HPY54_12250 [Chthonomonadetes bacterium]|nr:hypothetical protein [Chthonomonadetes bacterium]
MLRLYMFIILLLALTALPAASEDALDAKNDPRLQKEISVFQPPVPLTSSPEERARVVSTRQYLQITFGLTDGERQVMLSRLSVIQ